MSTDQQAAGQTADHGPFEYDVTISFAAEDRSVAQELADLLAKKNISVFFDEYTTAKVWGKDVVDHLVNLYARKARYCVMLVSQHYPLKQWTAQERRFAQERALRDANEYILPIRLDDTEAPGLNGAPGYRDLRTLSVGSIVELLEEKLTTATEQSGPPARSHDLRSGNVPPAEQKADQK